MLPRQVITEGDDQVGVDLVNAHCAQRGLASATVMAISSWPWP